jgi:hypothetical protein
MLSAPSKASTCPDGQLIASVYVNEQAGQNPLVNRPELAAAGTYQSIVAIATVI